MLLNVDGNDKLFINSCMASIISGYEYDVFISYRHKDNKYEGWVTDFYKNLSKELEATFKEDINVYLDENPVDGLLETHQVGKSLDSKLKCLVLVPILSQTYCDPKSFAWQNEFQAFNKFANQDRFGRDIKLRNGNVVSRILPVKIHDLDRQDQKLIEGEIGTVLRSVNFIYKEAGVNRPLRPTDDKKDNINKTDYRNQINKLANALKEIFSVLANDGSQHDFLGDEKDLVERNEAETFKSIAVFPFADMSPDSDQEHFSDGIAEEIINSLVHLKELKVAGRMSTFQFKDSKFDLREVGAKLGVSNVLEGSVRKQGNKLRVTAQLISIEDGFHLWSERYDRTFDDIFTIQDEIALAITEKLKITLLQGDREKITKVHTRNPVAYDLLLKGRFHLNRRGISILTAIQFFQKAIEAEPGFALPYVGIAEANLMLATYGMAPPKMVLPKAKACADQALKLDDTLFEPYCSLAYYFTTYEYDWPQAKRYYLKSLELNPKYCQAHSWYGWNYLSWVEGEFAAAEWHGEQLIKLEPLSATFYGSYSLILHTAGKLNKALAICQTGIELDMNAFLCRLNEGYIYMAMKKYEEAIVSFEFAIKISNRHHFAVNGLIWTYCLTENDSMARTLMDELKERNGKEYIGKTFMAISASYLGSLDEAFDLLEEAYQSREPVLLALRHEKWGTSKFREDVRFKNLISKIGFPN